MTSLVLNGAIEAVAGAAPDREVARFGGTAMTYGELVVRAGRLARVLQERGVRRGDRVGMLAGKGLHSPVAMYGIMRAGAAYVPLDPLAPVDRLATIVRDSGLSHLVSEPNKRATVRSLLDAGVTLNTVIGLEEHDAPGLGIPWAQVDTAPETTYAAEATGSDLAYILYTSGSTGVPKGVTHTHGSAWAFAEVAARTYGLRPDDRVSSHAPLHFDLSTFDFFATAIAGATTVIVPEAHTKLPASLSQLLADERVSVMYAVPLALTQLVLYGALDRRDLSRLRWVIFAGEPFPPKHLRSLMHAVPTAQFSNIYGPTEVNGVTHWEVPPVAQLTDEPLPIGRPFAGMDAMIVDADGSRTPDGEAGELWVRTPTMMLGYWGRPDLDASAFATVPGRDGDPQRYHRTGDLVRADADGVLHFLGRKDRQIKTRGYRVELDEIESVLLAHPAVQSAAAYGVPEALGTMVIEATIVLGPGTSVTTPEIVTHAARQLPRHAIPDHMTIVDALPTTNTGKVDRVALVALAVARRTATAGDRS